MGEDLILLDSITDATPEAIGKIGVSGSHGGMFAAAVASRAGLRAVALNDAGIGRDDAGLAGLKALDQVGMAGVAVTAMSACIGSARDSLENGIVGYCNAAAAALGVAVGAPLRSQIDRLAAAPSPIGMLPAVEEVRRVVTVGETSVLCVDSASLIEAGDAGSRIVTGSHGGLIGGDPARACKAEARFVCFNDAGGGKNDVGFSRLPALDERKIAAVTVSCRSCRIGDAGSALSGGVVSRCNEIARSRGCAPGHSLEEALRYA